MRHRLRLFTGDEETIAMTAPGPEMTVSLRELSTILADAVRSDRAWLQDFADEPVQVSSDLYDVLTTYWRLRPSA